MNSIFVILIALAYFATLWQQLIWHPSADFPIAPMQALGNSIFSSAEQAVELSIGLIGVMTFFLGLMKIAEAAGLLRILAKLLQPIMCRLFPDVPPDHPAQGAIIMNISANLLGLGNAATPFGIKAMQSLDSLNTHKGTATNAMVLFLAMNTASITLLPTKVIALRSAAGSQHPSDIIATTLFASICATIVAIVASKSLQRFFSMPSPNPSSELCQEEEALSDGCLVANATPCAKGDKPFVSLMSVFASIAKRRSNPVKKFIPIPHKRAPIPWISYFGVGCFLLTIPLTLLYGRSFSPWIIPTITLLILIFGHAKKIPVYEVFTEGAKEGFWVAVRIIPYLVSILVAMAMLKTSGALSTITQFISGFTAQFGLPAEALPIALLRPLSGGASMGVMTSLINDPAIGPDSYIGYLASTLIGATDTTFYIVALYFGAIQIKNIRHTIWAALLADLAGIVGSVFIVNRFFG